MESFLLLLAVGLLFIIVAPIVALVRSGKTQRQAETTQAEVELLRKRVAALEKELWAKGKPATEPPPLPETTEKLEAVANLLTQQISTFFRSGSSPSGDKDEGIPITSASETPAPQKSAPVPQDEGIPIPLSLEPQKKEPAPVSKAPAPAARPFDWESFFGTKFVAWVGGLALFLGMVYLIIESFQRGWISPTTRVCIGAAVGVALIAVGVRFRNTIHRTTMQTLTGTGVVILFAVIYACRAFYEFDVFTAELTFALLVMVAASAFVLAGVVRAQAVAVLGLLAGFATPLLVSTGEDHPVLLFTYLAVLTAGVLATGGRFRWPALAPLAAVGFVVLFLGWYGRFVGSAFLGNNYQESPRAWIPLIVALLFPLLHLAGAWAIGKAGFLQWNEDGGGAAESPKSENVQRWMLVSALALSLVPLVLGALWLCEDFWRGETTWMLAYLFLAGAPVFGVAALVKHRAGRGAEPSSGGTSGFVGIAQEFSWAVPLVSLFTAGALALWIGHASNDVMLWHMVGATVAFALLHGAGPLVLQRAGWLEPPGATAHLATLVALGLALLLFSSLRIPAPAAMGLLMALSAGAALLGVARKSSVATGTAAVLGLACFAVMLFAPKMGKEIFSGSGLWWWAGALCVFTGGFVVAGTRGLRDADAAKSDKAEEWSVLRDVVCAVPYGLLTMAMVMRAPGPQERAIVAWIPVELLVALAALGGILVVAANKLRLAKLFAVGLAGTLLVEYATDSLSWGYNPFSMRSGVELGGEESRILACKIFLFFALAFTAAPFVSWQRWKGYVTPWAVAALALPMHYLPLRVLLPVWLSEFVSLEPESNVHGLFAALLALPVVAGFAFVFKKSGAENPARVKQLTWLGGSVLFFVTVFFPEQFDRQWLTLGWAAEALALALLLRRVRHGGFGAVALGLLTVVFVRLTVYSELLGMDEYKKGAVFFNEHLYTYGVAMLCFAVAAWSFEGSGSARWREAFDSAAQALRAAAVFLGFLLVNIEIADYFTPVGATQIMFNVTGDWHGTAASFARGMSFTLAWGLFALGLVGAGLWRRAASARWVGLALLGVTLGKVFLFDLAGLGNLYRVAALTGTAIVAIGASLLYQRFLKRSRE